MLSRTLIALSVAAATVAVPSFAGLPISERFAADPSAHFFAGRYYVYATNDQDNSGKYWDSTDWRVFGSRDIVHWRDEGSRLSVAIFKWAKPDGSIIEVKPGRN
jgi:hypothetical protein